MSELSITGLAPNFLRLLVSATFLFACRPSEGGRLSVPLEGVTYVGLGTQTSCDEQEHRCQTTRSSPPSVELGMLIERVPSDAQSVIRISPICSPATPTKNRFSTAQPPSRDFSLSEIEGFLQGSLTTAKVAPILRVIAESAELSFSNTVVESTDDGRLSQLINSLDKGCLIAAARRSQSVQIVSARFHGVADIKLKLKRIDSKDLQFHLEEILHLFGGGFSFTIDRSTFVLGLKSKSMVTFAVRLRDLKPFVDGAPALFR